MPAPAPQRRDRLPKRKADGTAVNPAARPKRIRTTSSPTALINTVDGELLSAQPGDDERTTLGLSVLEEGGASDAPARRGRGRPRKPDHLLKHARKSHEMQSEGEQLPAPKTSHQQGEEDDEDEDEEGASSPLGRVAPEPAPKRPRGRPRKNAPPSKAPQITVEDEAALFAIDEFVKRGPSRPRKGSQTLNISRLDGKLQISRPVPTPTPEHTQQIADSSQTLRNNDSHPPSLPSEQRNSRSQTLRNDTQPTTSAAKIAPEKKERRGRPRKPDHLLQGRRIDPGVYQARKVKLAQEAKAKEAGEEPPLSHQPVADDRSKRGRGRPRKPDHLLMHPRQKSKM